MHRNSQQSRTEAMVQFDSFKLPSSPPTHMMMPTSASFGLPATATLRGSETSQPYQGASTNFDDDPAASLQQHLQQATTPVTPEQRRAKSSPARLPAGAAMAAAKPGGAGGASDIRSPADSFAFSDVSVSRTLAVSSATCMFASEPTALTTRSILPSSLAALKHAKQVPVFLRRTTPGLC